MLRDRLKTMDLRITELADYLQVSRPTMYKFIDYYDDKEFDLINKKVLKLFNFINENELVGKKSVINYILSNLVDVKDIGDKEENSVLSKIKKYLISNPESKKSKFLVTLATQDIFDDAICYLAKIQPLLKKRKITEEEKTLLAPYVEFFKEIQKFKGE